MLEIFVSKTGDSPSSSTAALQVTFKDRAYSGDVRRRTGTRGSAAVRESASSFGQFASERSSLSNKAKILGRNQERPFGSLFEQECQRSQNRTPGKEVVEGMLQPEMVAETAALMRTGVEQGVQMNTVIHNRAGGNAPIIAQRVAARFLEAYQNSG